MVLRQARVNRRPTGLEGNVVALLMVERRVEAVRWFMAFREHGGIARRQRLIVMHVSRIGHLWQWR